MRLFNLIFLLFNAFSLNSLHAASSLSKFPSETAWRAKYLRKVGIIAPSVKKTLKGSLAKSVDSAFLFAQADCAKKAANLTSFHKSSSVDLICQIDSVAGETNWAQLLNSPPTALAIGFMEQVESEFRQVKWTELLGISAEELSFCLEKTYRFEMDGEPEISLFWLFCYGYNIFPSLKKAILDADNVVEEACAQECLAQSLDTYLTISDVAHFSSKKKIWLCQFIEELLKKIEQLITQRGAVKLMQNSLEEFRASSCIKEYKLFSFPAQEELQFFFED